jgi:hypothetical protein
MDEQLRDVLGKIYLSTLNKKIKIDFNMKHLLQCHQLVIFKCKTLKKKKHRVNLHTTECVY